MKNHGTIQDLIDGLAAMLGYSIDQFYSFLANTGANLQDVVDYATQMGYTIL